MKNVADSFVVLYTIASQPLPVKPEGFCGVTRKCAHIAFLNYIAVVSFSYSCYYYCDEQNVNLRIRRNDFIILYCDQISF